MNACLLRLLWTVPVLAACAGGVQTRAESSSSEIHTAHASATSTASNPPPAVRTSQSCDVRPESVAVRQLEQSSSQALSEQRLSRTDIGDANGDGLSEFVLYDELATCGATGNCLAALYFTQADCARFAGVIAWRDSFELLPTRSHGVRDLRVFSSNGCAGLAGVEQTLRWDGTRYQLAGSVEHPCPP